MFDSGKYPLHFRPKHISLAICLFALISCGGGGGGGGAGSNAAPTSPVEPELSAMEKILQAKEQFDKQPVELRGQAVNQLGEAIAGAELGFVDSSEALGISDSNVDFAFASLTRRNRLLQVTADGYRDEYLAVHLTAPLAESAFDAGKIVLTADVSEHTRFLFGGDVAFGRRFIDPEEVTPPGAVPEDNPAALIKASDPQPGTQNVLQWIRPYYKEADFGVLNLETPVTNHPDTPHPTKSFVFFTLTESLAALKWAGVDYVSLGNNHLYDYLEQGTIDTVDNLNGAGIEHSGAGLNSTEAFAANRKTINGQNYAFFSATSVSGREHAFTYVADDSKGGAADLGDSDGVAAALKTEVDAGYIPIAQLHTGKEYTFEPTSYAQGRMQLVVDNGAQLTIAHHPHVAQGVGVIDGKVVVHGLGNLAFDQDRQETLMGLMARVDMNVAAVDQLRLLPVYLEDYRPRPITGKLADIFLRRISEFSHDYNAFVYPYQGQGWVAFNDSSFRTRAKTVTVDVTIPASGAAVVDLREWSGSEASLAMASTSNDVSLQLGRDLMLYGDFDDWDTDSDTMEAVRWDLSSDSRSVCLDAYRGTAALCTTRSSGNSSDSVTPYRNRIRVMGDALDTPNKSLSLFGYVKGTNAGAINLITRYYASAGSLTFGEETAFSHPGGSFDWQPFSADLTLPPDVAVEEGQVIGEFSARAVRLFIRHSPPATDQAVAAFDELAIISWENEMAPGAPVITPHAKDFLRVTGAPGTATLELRFEHYVPSGAQ